MAQDDAAFRKRNQISKANRMMFIWIAIASVLVGAASVVSLFLFQKISYGELVLGEKQTTANTLEHNLSVIDGLKSEVKALDANEALLSIKANESDEALQVVLDALPSEANSLALGASLQNKLLSGIDAGDFQLESLQVHPISGVELVTDSTTVDASASTDTGNTITFSFSARGDQAALQQVLQNLERSIRSMVLTKVNIEMQGSMLTMSVEGHAFYQPARDLKLTDKTVVPKK